MHWAFALSVSLIFLAVHAKPSTFQDSGTGTVGHFGEHTHGKSPLAGPWSVFISYRRSVSRHLAMLIKVLMMRENISAFIDVEDLGAGHWDEQLMEAIQESPNFVIVLSNGTLDRAIGDSNYTDFLHKEIQAAVTLNKTIIPIFDEYAHPNADFSPEIQEMMTFQGVEWNHSMVNATMDRIISYLIDSPVNSTNIKSETTHIASP
ncbi:Sterile alpha and TIR motif-containing protein 1 [Orchesella cincta]|uniref:Sterile alpha and TIR motif-containing protein 1 n=1 Tax=Orchesella cincta TaxID=48709 RepID=A0A1D2MZX7_ORCCI|nr:Sterile alpha and TIR motif-containing protein 1 [Orchesella cincta]